MNRSLLVVLAALLVALVAVAAFRPSFDNEFIWDDPIVFQRQLPYFDSLANVFDPPKSIPQFGTHYYRPLGVVSYQIDEAIATRFWPLEQRDQARQRVYHASVIFYHALASVLVLLLGLRLVALSGLDQALGLGAALGGSLLFAVHPIHVESVSWMAGRADVLCTIFLVAALLTWMRHHRRGRWPDLVAAGGFALAAMLCKETGVGALLLLPALDLLLPRPERAAAPAEGLTRAERRRLAREKQAAPRGVGWVGFFLPRWLVLAAAGGVYFLLRSQAIDAGHLKSSGASVGALFGALGWYFKKFFWPAPQSAFITLVPGGWWTLAGVVLLLGAGGAVWAVLSRQRRSGLGELVALGVFFAFLAPSLAIVAFRISETPLAERYLYAPSVGLCLLVPLLLARVVALTPLGARPVPALAAVLLPCVLVAVPMTRATLEREKVWQNNLAFWRDAVIKAPGEGLPHLHLGLTYNEMDYTEKAIEEYKLALQQYRDAEGRSKAYNNLGSAYIRLGKLEEASRALEGALEEVPRYATAPYNLALVQLRRARQARDLRERARLTNAALSGFRAAIRINPRYVKAHYQYGALLLGLGRADLGLEHLRKVIALAPSSGEAQAARKLLERGVQETR
ncbi:MAG: tetratricopeptide repeat protein [Acidobacteriota bacterium]|nr:tetratricopeptide repeat protein [Acidobacteriota bacterium]